MDGSLSATCGVTRTTMNIGDLWMWSPINAPCRSMSNETLDLPALPVRADARHALPELRPAALPVVRGANLPAHPRAHRGRHQRAAGDVHGAEGPPVLCV